MKHSPDPIGAVPGESGNSTFTVTIAFSPYLAFHFNNCFLYSFVLAGMGYSATSDPICIRVSSDMAAGHCLVGISGKRRFRVDWGGFVLSPLIEKLFMLARMTFVGESGAIGGFVVHCLSIAICACISLICLDCSSFCSTASLSSVASICLIAPVNWSQSPNLVPMQILIGSSRLSLTIPMNVAVLCTSAFSASCNKCSANL